jgi:hypothetical protein
MDLAAGQRWTYRTPLGFQHSRLVIGAVLVFAEHERVVCCSVTDAPRRLPDGRLDTVTIPFIPITESAFRATALARDGEAATIREFEPAFAEWRGDPRGLSFFTVPFEGFLDRMIAMQMAAILEQRSAA